MPTTTYTGAVITAPGGLVHTDPDSCGATEGRRVMPVSALHIKVFRLVACYTCWTVAGFNAFSSLGGDLS